MTLVVGMRKADRYWLLADTKINGDTGCEYVNTKIRRVTNNCHIAIAGDLGPFANCPLPVKKAPNKYTSGWIYSKIVKPMFAEYASFSTDSSRIDFSLLVATCDGLFVADSDGCVYHKEPVVCMGSGAEFAYGYLSNNLPPDDTADLFQKCSMRIPSVGAEFDFACVRVRSV